MRKIGIMVFAVLLLFAFASCQRDGQAVSTDPNAPVTLDVWCWDPNFNIFAMLEAEKIYQRIRPNVSLNVMDITSIEERLIAALSANDTSTLPDIILQQDNSIEKFVTNFPRAYLPLNGHVDLSQFAPFKLAVGYVNGQNYGVPFDNGATALFLRRDFIEQAGLRVEDFNNITWDRFIELGRRVRQATGKPMFSYGVQNGPEDLVHLVLMSTGSWYFDGQGRLNIQNNPAIREIINLYKNLIDNQVFLEVPDWNAYIASFSNEQVVGTLQGCWIIGSITPLRDQEGLWAMVNTPRLNTPGAANYSSQGGSGWMVMSHTRYRDVAFDFLDKVWAGSVEFYETILPPSGAISTWLPAANSTIYSQPQAFFGGQRIYEELMDFAARIPQVNMGVYSYEARSAVARAAQNVSRGANIDQELAAAHQEVQFLMDM